MKIKDYATKYLGQRVEVKIDRPLHTKHPEYAWDYKLNYGYVPGTEAPDGEEIDAYVMGVDKPLATFIGTVIAVIHRTNDDDDKLVVNQSGDLMSEEEIKSSTNFQEKYFDSEIIFLSTLVLKNLKMATRILMIF